MQPRPLRASRFVMLAAATTVAAIASACFDTSGLGGGDGANQNDGSISDTGIAESSVGEASVPDADGGCASFEGTCNGGGAIDVAAGQYFGCAVLASGSVWCWGSNAYGQVGQAPTTSPVPPTEVPGISDAVAVRAGGSFACALKSDRTVACWGSNVLGQLGHDPASDALCTGSFPCDPTPTLVSKAQFITAIAANYSNACALNTEGATYCWGDNSLGQLGFVGDGGFVPTPTAITGLHVPEGGIENGTSVSCVRDPSTGRISCLGSNYDQALGHAPGTYGDVDSGFGYDFNTAAEPVTDETDAAIGGFSNFCYGSLHGCGVVAGAATCWGRLGGPNGLYVENPPTHEISGTAGATQVACGAFHTCILQGSEGNVLCWGNNWDCAVGTGYADGGSYGAIQTPTPVGLQAKVIRGGYGQTVAIDADGAVWQWGGGDAFADASIQPTPRKLEGLP